jgi:hypothetical protein
MSSQAGASGAFSRPNLQISVPTPGRYDIYKSGFSGSFCDYFCLAAVAFEISSLATGVRR